MHVRHTLSLASITLALVACGQSHGPEGDADGGTTPPPDGASGVCCPIDLTFTGCSPGIPGRASGGWAASAADCAGHTVSGFDGRPFARQIDANGCDVLVEIAGCCGCVDGGPPPPPPADAGPPGECAGLNPAECLAAWCVPMFDDSCCSECTPGPCADCYHPQYRGCVPEAASSCRGGPGCGDAPIWACGPAAPFCDDAHVVADDACDRVGCVPAYPSGTGPIDPAAATCVPITAQSCTVACRRLPPECPPGTWAEGDGSCYTDRCIPAFVCE